MPFSYDGTRFFLTYAQSGDLSKDDVVAHLRGLRPIKWMRICYETHEDGGRHIHCCGEFAQRLKSRNERIFDVNGKHPNVRFKLSKNWPFGAIEYVSKEGDTTDIGNVPMQAAIKRAWADFVEAAKGNEMEWLQVVHEERIMPHVAKRLRELQFSAKLDLDEYDGRPISDSLQVMPDEIKSVLVVGRPGCGKTGWAMLHMPRPCLLVKHLDCLRGFRDDYHKSIFFDDCDFKHLPRQTQLMLADYEDKIQVHVRYGVALIPAKIPRLFACNFNNEPFIQDSAIQGRRLLTIYLSQ